MEKSTRERLLDAGLDLLGREGFRTWSVRGVEDAAGLPHGSVRHHFAHRRGLVLALVRHLLDLDLAGDADSPEVRVRRWLGADRLRTRARYELVVASFHDAELAAELVRGRDRFVDLLVAAGLERGRAIALVAALDGHVLDSVLRGRGPNDPEVDPGPIIAALSA